MRTLIILFIFLSNQILSQKFEINLSFDPLTHRLGNLRQEFIKTINNNEQLSSNSLHYSDVIFYSVIGKQISINTLFRKKKFIFGFDINYFQHEYRFDIKYGYFLAPRSIKINNLGLSVLFGKELKFNTRILAGIEFTVPYDLSSNINVLVNSINQASISTEEFFPRNSAYFAPKVIGNTYLTKRIYLNYGFRLKFWDRKTGGLSFYSFNLRENDKIYLDLSLNTKQIHFFLGFGVTLNSKNEKN